MTTGTRDIDLRYTDADGKLKALGKRSYKSWSGADATAKASAQKAVMKALWPGSWYLWKANHASYWQELPLRGPDGKFSKRNFTETVRRLDFLHRQWRNRVDLFMAERKKYLDLKEVCAAHRRDQHPYQVNIIRSDDTPCSWRQIFARPGPWHNNVGAAAVFGDQVSPPSCWDSNDDNALIEKLRSKLNGVPGFHAGVAAAELERTCKMVGNVAVTMRRFGQQMGKGDVKGGLRVLFNGDASYHSWFNALPRAAQLYLGLQFGLLPLLDDVSNGAAMLGWQAGLTERPMRIRVRRERKASARSKNPVVMGWDTTERSQIVALLSRKPRSVDFSGLTDIASILWERQWMSFVVDWWIPVGSALSALQLSQILQGTFVTTRTTKYTRTNYTSGSGVSSYQVIGDSSFYKQVLVKRTVDASLIPKMPKLKPILHPKTRVAIKHATEAGALLIVNRKKIQRGVDWLRSESQHIKHGELFSSSRGIPGSPF